MSPERPRTITSPGRRGIVGRFHRAGAQRHEHLRLEQGRALLVREQEPRGLVALVAARPFVEGEETARIASGFERLVHRARDAADLVPPLDVLVEVLVERAWVAERAGAGIERRAEILERSANHVRGALEVIGVPPAPRELRVTSLARKAARRCSTVPPRRRTVASTTSREKISEPSDMGGSYYLVRTARACALTRATARPVCGEPPPALTRSRDR